MLSFHNSEAVKEKYLARVRAHIAADNLIRGTGWEKGKGCAVGCTLEAYEHESYETELGLPEWLARLEDNLFEGMSLEKSKTWPEAFLKVIPLGVTKEQFTRNVTAPFLVLVLKSALNSFDNEAFPDVTEAVNGSISLWQRNDIGSDAWWSAAEAAEAAAWAAKAAALAAEAEAEAEAAVAEAAACAAEAWAAKYDYFADELLKLLENAKG